MKRFRNFLSSTASVSVYVFVVSMFSCSGDNESTDPTPNPPVESKSSAKSIVSFAVQGYETEVDEAGRTITITMPGFIDVKEVTPTVVVSEKATLSPASGTAIDISAEATYTVTAEDKSEQRYTIKVKYTYGLKEFKMIAGGYQTTNGKIDHVKKEIVLDAKFSDIRSALLWRNTLVTEITMQNGETISPVSGSTIDLADPEDHYVHVSPTLDVPYKVVIRNVDNTLRYFVLNEGAPIVYSGSNKDDLFPDDPSLAGLSSNAIVVPVLSTENVTNYTNVRIDISERATISPDRTAIKNFTNDVQYTITSETGAARVYTVRVVKKSLIIINEYHYYTPQISNDGSVFTEHYNSISEITGAKLISQEGKADVACTVSSWQYSGSKQLRVKPTAAFEKGTYKLEITLANGEVILIRPIYTAG